MGLDHRLQGGGSGEHSRSSRLFGPPWVHGIKRRKKKKLYWLSYSVMVVTKHRNSSGENPDGGTNHRSDPNNQAEGERQIQKPVGDLIIVGSTTNTGRGTRDSSGRRWTGSSGNWRISLAMDWDRGECWVEALEGPWEFPGRADEEGRDRGANQQGRPWDRGRVRGRSVEPWKGDRGTGEWLKRGKPGWSWRTGKHREMAAGEHKEGIKIND